MSNRGQRLVDAMHRQGIYKQHALAHLLGVQESTITRWKNNKAISVDHAIAVCEALSISLDWFLCGIGPIDRPAANDEEGSPIWSTREGLEEAHLPFSFDAATNSAASRTYLL